MKRFIYIWITLITAFSSSFAQSYDEKIADAMNKGDWFALDSVYKTAPKDSIWSFLEVYSRCLIGNRLNRPDVSIPAFTELLNTQSENLDLGNMLNSSVMFAMDLSRTGENAEAASMLTSILDATRQYLDSAAIAGVRRYIGKYAALSAYKPYGSSFGDSHEGSVPFRYVPVGPADKNSILMHLDKSTINGAEADITFDTGAGVNIISDSLALKYGLVPLDAFESVGGMGVQSGRYAIAKELKLGNITVTDVPFVVLTLTTNNKEADQYIDCFGIVVGSELMLQLKDLTVDFVNRRISVPSDIPSRSDARPNMCFSSSMNLLARGMIHDNPMLVNIDTGDASYGILDKTFLDRNKEFVMSHSPADSVRMAGIGGVHISQCYRVPDMTARLGGSTVTIPVMDVRMQDNPAGMDYECNFGLKSLRLFGKIRFNMVDFTLTTYPQVLSLNKLPALKVPEFTVTKDRGIKPLQAVGLVAVGVARGLINPNAPSNPDL